MPSDALPVRWDLLIVGDTLLALTTAWWYRRSRPKARIAVLAPTAFHETMLPWPQWIASPFLHAQLDEGSQAAWRPFRRTLLWDSYWLSVGRDRWLQPNLHEHLPHHRTWMDWRQRTAQRLYKQLRHSGVHFEINVPLKLRDLGSQRVAVQQGDRVWQAHRVCIALTHGLPPLSALTGLSWQSQALPIVRLDRSLSAVPVHTPYGSLVGRQLIGQRSQGGWLAEMMGLFPALNEAQVTRLGRRRRDSALDGWPRCHPLGYGGRYGWCTTGFVGGELPQIVALGAELAAALEGDRPSELLQFFWGPATRGTLSVAEGKVITGAHP